MTVSQTARLIESTGYSSFCFASNFINVTLNLFVLRGGRQGFNLPTADIFAKIDVNSEKFDIFTMITY